MTQKNTISTIKLSQETKNRLEHIKEYKRESYEEVVQKMLEILNICKVSPLRARARLVGIDRKNRAKSSQLKRIKPQIRAQMKQIKPQMRNPSPSSFQNKQSIKIQPQIKSQFKSQFKPQFKPLNIQER